MYKYIGFIIWLSLIVIIYHKQRDCSSSQILFRKQSVENCLAEFAMSESNNQGHPKYLKRPLQTKVSTSICGFQPYQKYIDF